MRITLPGVLFFLRVSCADLAEGLGARSRRHVGMFWESNASDSPSRKTTKTRIHGRKSTTPVCGVTGLACVSTYPRRLASLATLEIVVC